MAGGYLFPGGRVIHVLNSVFAKQQAPICLRLGREICDNAVIDSRCSVKVTVPAQLFRPQKKACLFFIIDGWHRLPSAAIFALRNAGALCNREISAAHLALDDSHLISSSILCFLYFYAMDCKSQAHSMISFLECLVSCAMKLSSFTNSLGRQADATSVSSLLQVRQA